MSVRSSTAADVLTNKQLLSNAAVGFQQTQPLWMLAPDKAHFSHVAGDTSSPHLSKQQTWVWQQAPCDSCPKSTREYTQLHYTKADEHTILPGPTSSYAFALLKQMQGYVSQQHSAGFANSQVCILCRQSLTQTGCSRSPQCCHMQELRRCWCAPTNTVFTSSYAPRPRHPLSHHQRTPNTHPAELRCSRSLNEHSQNYIHDADMNFHNLSQSLHSTHLTAHLIKAVFEATYQHMARGFVSVHFKTHNAFMLCSLAHHSLNLWRRMDCSGLVSRLFTDKQKGSSFLLWNVFIVVDSSLIDWLSLNQTVQSKKILVQRDIGRASQFDFHKQIKTDLKPKWSTWFVPTKNTWWLREKVIQPSFISWKYRLKELKGDWIDAENCRGRVRYTLVTRKAHSQHHIFYKSRAKAFKNVHQSLRPVTCAHCGFAAVGAPWRTRREVKLQRPWLTIALWRPQETDWGRTMAPSHCGDSLWPLQVKAVLTDMMARQ